MTGWGPSDRAAIVGVGETRYWRAGGAASAGVSEFALACTAVVRALDDAGLSVSDVDGMCAYGNERSSPVALAQALGLDGLRFVSLYPGGGNASCGVVHHAVLAVSSGEADVVVCYRSLCQGQYGRFGRARAGSGLSAAPLGATIGGGQAFTAPFGLMSPAQTYALEARRHMHEFGTRVEHLAEVALAAYAHAQRNPRAVMHGRPLDLERYLSARPIADPYRLYDCCLESDGACAVVVTSTERARDLPQPLCTVAASAVGLAPGDGPDRTARPRGAWTSAGLASTARRVYERAGIGPSDVSTAQVYENFTGQVLMALEDFGFAPRGGSGDFVEGGTLTWPDGALPVNTSGGNLAEAYVHGLSHVLEGTRQIRGTSTCQVPGASHCLVVAGPSAPPSGALVLRGAAA